MIRRPVAVVGAVAVAAVLSASAPTDAAAPASGGTAYSAAATSGALAPITPTIKVCALGLVGTCSSGALGAVSGLLGSLLTPVNAIVADVQALPTRVVAAVVGTGLSASQPAVQLSRPDPQTDPATGAPAMPACGQQGWDASGTGDCYAGLPVTLPANTVLGLDVSAASGYATDDPAGYVGAAQVDGTSLSLLGASLGTIATVWASAQCSNDPSSPNCQAANSTVTASLLPSVALPAGALAVKVGGTGTPQVLSVNGAALSASNNTVAVPGVGTVTVALTGSLLTLSVPLSTSQLTSLLPSLVGLSGPTSNGSITIGIGPGATSTTSGAIASGLTISADVSLDIKLSVLGLVSAQITTGSGIANPDLLNLSLAYSAATAGVPAASWIPPGLI